MRTLILSIISILALLFVGCGKSEADKIEEENRRLRAEIENTKLKAEVEANKFRLSLVGRYGNLTNRSGYVMVLQDNGVCKELIMKDGRVVADMGLAGRTWKEVNGELHLVYKGDELNLPFTMVYRINADNSLTTIARINERGIRSLQHKDLMSTYPKIK